MQEIRNNSFGSKIRSTTHSNALLLYFSTRAYLFSPEERSCYVFLTRNNCCEFLASYGVIIQSVIQSLLKWSWFTEYYVLRKSAFTIHTDKKKIWNVLFPKRLLVAFSEMERSVLGRKNFYLRKYFIYNIINYVLCGCDICVTHKL